MSEYQISLDDYIFFIEVIHYSPAVKGEKSYNSASERDYLGYDAEVLWECTRAFDCSESMVEISVDHLSDYYEKIKEKLLDILSELSENSRQEELERVIDMKGY